MNSVAKRVICGCGCSPLIHAINQYIEKADNDLEKQMSVAGFVNAEDSVSEASSLEENLADVLEEQTSDIAKILKDVTTVAAAKEILQEFFEEDETREYIKQLFQDFYQKNVVEYANSYIKESTGDLVVEQVRQRTSAWIDSWSDELSSLMQLNSEKQIGKLVENAVNNGESVADLSRKLIEEGIRNEQYQARRVALTEMLRCHSVAQNEAMQQDPAVTKKRWRHTGSYKNEPRANHVSMDGQIVDKEKPFTLAGRDGINYYPMYPRDTNLPGAESINCKCIAQSIVDDDICGMSLEERQELQQQIIDEDDGKWEKELDAKNKAKAGIDDSTIEYDWIRGKSKEDQIKYFGGGHAGKARWALLESGTITNDAELSKLFKTNTQGISVRKTLKELNEDGIFTVSSKALKHSTKGDFSGLRNPKKPAGGRNGGNMTSGGHSQVNLDELSNNGISYSIEKVYKNGVRIGGVANHNTPEKRLGNSGQSWFPENWDSDKVIVAGTYTANKPAIIEELYNDDDGKLIGYRKFQEYDNVRVGIYEDAEHNIGTIFPDAEQREDD